MELETQSPTSQGMYLPTINRGSLAAYYGGRAIKAVKLGMPQTAKMLMRAAAHHAFKLRTEVGKSKDWRGYTVDYHDTHLCSCGMA